MIGHYLKMLRIAAGRKSVEVARILGTTSSHYSLTEAGHSTPARHTLERWAKRLGVSHAALEFLAQETPKEFTPEEVKAFQDLKSGLMETLIFQFMNLHKPAEIKEVEE